MGRAPQESSLTKSTPHCAKSFASVVQWESLPVSTPLQFVLPRSVSDRRTEKQSPRVISGQLQQAQMYSCGLTNAKEQPLRVNVVRDGFYTVWKLVRVWHEMACRRVSVRSPPTIHVHISPPGVAQTAAHHCVSNLHEPTGTQPAMAMRAIVAEVVPARGSYSEPSRQLVAG
jgi:hypothetical protein